MAGYFVANYTITNQGGYKEYLAAVGPSLKAHGAEIIIVDRGCELLEGSAGHVTVVLRFASKAAAQAWYQSPEYQVIRHLRTDNTEGIGSSRRADSPRPHRFCFTGMNTWLRVVHPVTAGTTGTDLDAPAGDGGQAVADLQRARST